MTEKGCDEKRIPMGKDLDGKGSHGKKGFDGKRVPTEKDLDGKRF